MLKYKFKCLIVLKAFFMTISTLYLYIKKHQKLLNYRTDNLDEKKKINAYLKI